MNKDALKLFYVVFIGMGVIFFGIGVAMYFGSLFVIDNASDSAMQLSESITDQVEKELETLPAEYRPDLAEMQEYQEEKIQTEVGENKEDMYVIGLVFGIIGFACIAIGAITLYFSRKRKKEILYLKSFGYKVMAEVTAVEKNTMLSVNGKNPYQVYAYAKDPQTGIKKLYKSDNIWIDPNRFIKVGDTVEVSIHPQKNDRYYVNLEGYLPR